MESQIEEIEISIEQSKQAIADMESVLKLTKHKDFKKIIIEGYFEKEASRLVLLKAEPALQSDNDQKEIDKRINAIGYLRQYLNYLMQIGRMAEKSLKESEEEIEAIRGEVV